MDIKISVYCDLEGESRSFELEFSQEAVTIGSAAENDIRIPDVTVPAKHSLIVGEGEGLFLDLLGEGSSATVDDQEAEPGSRVPLEMGAEVRIESYRLVLTRPQAKLDESTSEKTSLVAMQMVREVLGSLGGEIEPPYFEVLNDAEKGTRLELPGESNEYSIGREKGCDLILKHWSISRKHALVRHTGEQITVVDLNSKNGVALNGDRLTEPGRVTDGDMVSVGHTELRYRDPSAAGFTLLDDSPTPIHDLRDLGLDMGGAAKPEELLPEPTGRIGAPGTKSRIFTRERLPVIVGGILLVAALVVAVLIVAL